MKNLSKSRFMKPVTSLFFITTLIIGCSTVEESAVPAETEAPVKESSHPSDWFVNRADLMSDESGAVSLSGYARGIGYEAEEAIDAASAQAAVNLRGRIDEQLERARVEAGEESGAMSDTAFIKELRNAVIALDLSGAETSSEHSEKDGVVLANVTVELPASWVLDSLEKRLGPHRDAWMLMAQTEVLQAWR